MVSKGKDKPFLPSRFTLVSIDNEVMFDTFRVAHARSRKCVFALIQLSSSFTMRVKNGLNNPARFVSLVSLMLTSSDIPSYC